MKFEWNKKYTQIAVYAFLVLSAVVLFTVCLIDFGRVTKLYNRVMTILNPLIIGLIFAYLLNPLVKFFDNKALRFVEKKKPHKRLKRALAVTLAYVTFLLALTLVLLFIVPQVVYSYRDFVAKAGSYITSAVEWIDNLFGSTGKIAEKYHDLLANFDFEVMMNHVSEFINNSYSLIFGGATSVIAFIGNFLNQVINIFIGFIFSIYVLLSKEKLGAQCKKLMYALFNKDGVDKTLKILDKTDKTIGEFIIGKIIDSIIIGMLTFIVLGIVNMPYYPLISVIIGITNIIPFFGPFIGAVPSAFIIFVAKPSMTLWFVLIIFVIQQLDGNVIGPKILGNKTGLSSLWIIVAITVMSGILGVPGMFVGVPIFAVIYGLLKEFAEKKLAKKNLPVSSEDYKKE